MAKEMHIVPSVSRECLILKDLCPAVLLASGQSSSLLPSMFYRFHRGLRTFCRHFIGGQKASSRVEIPYAYLMARLKTHYEGLMSGGVNANKEDFPTLCQFEGRR